MKSKGVPAELAALIEGMRETILLYHLQDARQGNQ